MKQVKAMPFEEMVHKADRKWKENKKFVDETGLCSACKKNPVDEELYNTLKCKECIDKTEDILKQLRGQPGFVEIGRK